MESLNRQWLHADRSQKATNRKKRQSYDGRLIAALDVLKQSDSQTLDHIGTGTTHRIIYTYVMSNLLRD